MTKTLQAVRGMNDWLPETTSGWQVLESCLKATATRYGYQEIRLPVVERTALFKRTLGQETDIVSKEMYTFEDRDGSSLTLRPEGTAGCVRAGIERGFLYHQIQRLWYLGPMFRHERPQKGRYRQFYQFGIEAFGIADAYIDAEQIAMSARIWNELGLTDWVQLDINSLGDADDRARYRHQLVRYLEQHKHALDADSLRRLELNPLRILDSKNPDMQRVIEGAPRFWEALSDSSKRYFEQVCAYLDAMGVTYKINPRIVRGLDYYSHTVYEWTTDKLGAQGTVCAGGRYDKLVEQLGGQPTPAVGFAIGLERVLALLYDLPQCNFDPPPPDVFLIGIGEPLHAQGLRLAEQLRQGGCSVVVSVGRRLKNELKKADKSGAKVAVIIGEQELAEQKVVVKYLRASERAQEHVSFEGLVPLLKKT